MKTASRKDSKTLKRLAVVGLGAFVLIILARIDLVGAMGSYGLDLSSGFNYTIYLISISVLGYVAIGRG